MCPSSSAAPTSPSPPPLPTEKQGQTSHKQGKAEKGNASVIDLQTEKEILIIRITNYVKTNLSKMLL